MIISRHVQALSKACTVVGARRPCLRGSGAVSAELGSGWSPVVGLHSSGHFLRDSCREPEVANRVLF